MEIDENLYAKIRGWLNIVHPLMITLRDYMNTASLYFLAEVGKSEVFLSLRKHDALIERVLVCDGYSLLEKLLPAIDAMLQKHQLETSDIARCEVVSDLPEGYSARRITETIASVYGFAIT